MIKIALCHCHHAEAKGARNISHDLNEHDEGKKVNFHLAKILIGRGFDVHQYSGRLRHKIDCINAAGDFDLAIETHFNAGGGRGCEVIHVPRSPRRSFEASIMSSEIANCLGVKDRGAKEGWYKMDIPGLVDYDGDIDGDERMDAFVSQTNCAAFIPEPFFIDDDEAVKHWLIENRHEQIAMAIAEGVEAAGWR